MSLKVLQLNHSDQNGGAARAAYRIHQALRLTGVDSRLLVNVSSSGEATVLSPGGSLVKEFRRVRSKLASPFRGLLKTGNAVLHSPALIPSRWPDFINASDADLVHLHWVQGEMLSILDIARIRKPIVWTLHDMWAFCGAEHYTCDGRWREGYRASNRPAHESGLDLNRWIWLLKKRLWSRPMHLVCPSDWLSQCVAESVLMRQWPVATVPNPIDTQRWAPIDQPLARDLLQLPRGVPLLLFGAMGGARDPRKGFDLLMQALHELRGHPLLNVVELLVVGQAQPLAPLDFGFPVHYLGHLHDDLSLRALYSAADAVLIPSRQDNLPNVGVEAQACGTQLVAFDTCGLRDLIDHRCTGYLARPFSPVDFAQGILWALQQAQNRTTRQRVRDHALNTWDQHLVAKAYLDVYERHLASPLAAPPATLANRSSMQQ